MHSTFDYAKAATLRVVLQTSQRLARAAPDDRAALFARIHEIDLAAAVAQFFGPDATLSAQGTNRADVLVAEPRMSFQIKFFSGSNASSWRGTGTGNPPLNDWKWLISDGSAQDPADSRVFIMFFPGSELKSEFTNCVSLAPEAKSSTGKFAPSEFLPLRRRARISLPR